MVVITISNKPMLHLISNEWTNGLLISSSKSYLWSITYIFMLYLSSMLMYLWSPKSTTNVRYNLYVGFLQFNSNFSIQKFLVVAWLCWKGCSAIDLPILLCRSNISPAISPVMPLWFFLESWTKHLCGAGFSDLGKLKLLFDDTSQLTLWRWTYWC